MGFQLNTFIVNKLIDLTSDFSLKVDKLYLNAHQLCTKNVSFTKTRLLFLFSLQLGDVSQFVLQIFRYFVQKFKCFKVVTSFDIVHSLDTNS